MAYGPVNMGGGLDAHPVGSLYLSLNSTSPAALFGGTWEQIKDTFILAAGNTYKAGATGGEAKHTLTLSEIAAHTHTGSTGEAGGHSHTASTGSAGSHSHTGSSGSAGSHSHSAWTGGAGGHNHTVSSASVTKYGISTLIGEGSAEYGFQSNSSTPTTSWVSDHTHGVGMNEAGAHTHTVSIGDAGAHTHTVSVTSGGSHTHTVAIGSSGGGAAHNNMPPYLVAYIWKRVA